MPFPIYTEPLPLQAGPQPNTDLDLARHLAQVSLKPDLQVAPLPLEEWVGREQLLAKITQDWFSPEQSITGLIGFGGEGKTSLARRWVTELRLNRLPCTPTGSKPDGIFWWDFYERNSVDEFFEAALNYLSAEQVDLSTLPSANARANFLAGMLRGKRYLFILDGFEVMQHEQGDEYAQIKSADLYDFLTYFAAGGHESFCLITSRAPLLDLIEYTSYTNRNVDRLSNADGRSLLRKIGVQGTVAQLDRLVNTWDGHALTLSLLGFYLVDRYHGDITRITNISTPTADEDPEQRVQRVLRRYDEHLTEAEQIFLKIFSVFRLPIQQSAFKQVFRDKTKPNALNAPLIQLSPPDFKALIQQLIKYRILRFNPHTHYYKLHPLVRNHYFKQLKEHPAIQLRPLYRSIKDYYLGQSGGTTTTPTLDSLMPLLEVVHYICEIEAYDTAWQFYWERISQRNRYVLIALLCAYETTIATLQEFFSNGDTSQDPLVTSATAKYLILEEIGICWAGLGYLNTSWLFYERAKAVALTAKNWEKASLINQRLSELHIFRGELSAGSAAAQESFTYAKRARNSWTQMEALVHQAIAADLQGNRDTSADLFLQAEARQQKMQNDTRHLFSWRGIAYANFLNRTGRLSHAEAVAEENLQICQEKGWLNLVGKANRTLGDINLNSGRQSNARQYYDAAIKIARSTPRLDALIESLLSRGQWATRYGDLKAARHDFCEALHYATVNGYRLFEADVRAGLAELHNAEGNPSAARSEATQAQEMSREMGYAWGAIAAAEILEKIL